MSKHPPPRDRPPIITHPPEIGLYALLHHSSTDYIIKFSDEFENSLLSWPTSSLSEVRIINLGEIQPEPGRYLVIYVGNRCFEVQVVKRCIPFAVAEAEGIVPRVEVYGVNIADCYWGEFRPLIIPMQRTKDATSESRKGPPTPKLEPLDILTANENLSTDDSDCEEGKVTKANRLKPHSPTLFCLPTPPDDTHDLPQITPGEHDAAVESCTLITSNDAGSSSTTTESIIIKKKSISPAFLTPTELPHLPNANHVRTSPAFPKPPPIPDRNRARLPSLSAQHSQSLSVAETSALTETPDAIQSISGTSTSIQNPPPTPATCTSRIPVRSGRTSRLSFVEDLEIPKSSDSANQSVEGEVEAETSVPSTNELGDVKTSPRPHIFKRDKRWRKPVPHFYPDELEELKEISTPVMSETKSQITHSGGSSTVLSELNSVVELVKPMFEVDVAMPVNINDNENEDENDDKEREEDILARVFSRGSSPTQNAGGRRNKRKRFWERFRRGKSRKRDMRSL